MVGNGDDDQNGHDGPDVDVLEVHICHFDQVFRHGALAGDDALGVNGLDEGCRKCDSATIVESKVSGLQ